MTAESDFCSTMKGEVCYVSNVPTKKESGCDIGSGIGGGASKTLKAQYQLPEGQVINLGNELIAPPPAMSTTQRPGSPPREKKHFSLIGAED